jgi:hypothetical protein
MEAEAAAKKARKAADAAFLEMLREAAPPLALGTSFESAQQQLSSSEAWAAVEGDGRRQELFSAYMSALAQVGGMAAVSALLYESPVTPVVCLYHQYSPPDAA